MSSVIPPAIQEALERIAERIERHVAIQRALNYIRCRRDGGSPEECMGLFRLGSPPPGDPFFDELLKNVDDAVRQRLLVAVKDQLMEEVKRIDEKLHGIDATAAAPPRG